MSNLAAWLLASAAGLGLGVIFFGGLWWTVRRAIGARRPALWFLGSLVVRVALVLLGFHLVAGGQWQRLLASLIGFVIARSIMIRLIRIPPVRRPWRGREAGDAP